MNWTRPKIVLSNPFFRAFTFIETIVGIAVVSLTMGLLGFLIFSGQDAMQNADNHLGKLGVNRQAYDALRSLSARIQPPYWADPDSVASETGGEIRFAYLDGQPDQKAVFRQSDRGFEIAINQEATIKFPAAQCTVSLAKHNETVIGLSVNFTWLGQSYDLVLPWGSQTL